MSFNLQSTTQSGSFRNTAGSGLFSTNNLRLYCYSTPTGNPPAAIPIGAIYYNCVNGYIMQAACVGVAGASGWSTGGSLGQSRRFHGSAGNVNAGLTFAGINNPAAPAGTTCTEEYNGTSWSGGGNMTTGRYWVIQAGTQNDALTGGGYRPPAHQPSTEGYNGTSWSAETAMPTPQWYASGATGASQNSALTWGASTLLTCTFEYNGISWSAGGTSPAPALGTRGAGTQNDALRAGGANTATNSTAEYNGTSWSGGGNQPATQRNGEAWGASTNAAGTTGGRAPGGITVCTILYNGTSWSGATNNPSNVFALSGAGPQLAAFVGGGNNPTVGNVNEYKAALIYTCCLVCWCRRGPYNPI
jgi:hypothetical protein